jgi:hypothetical protein
VKMRSVEIADDDHELVLRASVCDRCPDMGGYAMPAGRFSCRTIARRIAPCLSLRQRHFDVADPEPMMVVAGPVVNLDLNPRRPQEGSANGRPSCLRGQGVVNVVCR